MRVILETSLEH